MAGKWSGRWGGRAKSTLTVSGDSSAAIQVEDCYKDRCYDIEEFIFDDATLGWRN